MLRKCLLGLALLLLPACAAKKSTGKPTMDVPSVTAGRTYYGVLPCPFDCKSVGTETTFFDYDHRFVMEETFIGLPGGESIEQTRGEWSTLKGHGGNPNAEVYELISEQFEDERYFLKVSDDELRALDRQGKEIRTNENVT